LKRERVEDGVIVIDPSVYEGSGVSWPYSGNQVTASLVNNADKSDNFSLELTTVVPAKVFKFKLPGWYNIRLFIH